MALVEELIARNKAQYGAVYSTQLKGLDIYYRPLAVSEYEALERDDLTVVELEDKVVEWTVFWPVDFNADKFPAGNISSLANYILEISSFADIADAQKTLEEARERSNSVTNIMKATILAVRSVLEYSMDDLNGLTFKQLCEVATLAEQIIRVQKIIYDPSMGLEIDFGPAEEEEQQGQSPPPGNGAVTNDPTAARLRSALGG